MSKYYGPILTPNKENKPGCYYGYYDGLLTVTCGSNAKKGSLHRVVDIATSTNVSGCNMFIYKFSDKIKNVYVGFDISCPHGRFPKIFKEV